VRRANPRELPRYLAAVTGRCLAAARGEEVLDAATARGEAAFLALRTRAGLDAPAFAAEFGASPRGFWSDAIDALAAEGLVDEAADGSLRLTRPGRLLADRVFQVFV
jgi:coproporphyrinogen III oxidase-like Fe-S oxidoreductase